MKKWLMILCSSVMLLAETAVIDPIEIYETALPAGSYVLSEEEAAETADITLQDRLERDVAFTVVPDGKGEGALSFRGVDYRATEYIEDGIPLYRSVNGFADTKFKMSSAQLQMNDGSGTSSLGVSSMGGEVKLVSERPTKTVQSRLHTTVSTNDEYYYADVGSRMENGYIQADAGYYHRSEYELADDYEATPLQGKGKRLNSDKEQRNASIKGGLFLGSHTHLAAKVSVSRSEYGMPPNAYTDVNAAVWERAFDTYTRIERKDLNSFYLYADYETDEVALNFRGYYDEYEDIWAIFEDDSYQALHPWADSLMTYDDSRMGTILKGSLKQGSHESSFVFQAERNEHNAREEGAVNDPKFVLESFKSSLLHSWQISDDWQLDGGVTYTLLHEAEVKHSTAEPADDKTALDAQLKAAYTIDESSFYGSIAKKSRMPAMNEMFTFFPWEMANPGLDPERSWQSAAGYQQMLDKTSLIDAALFYYDIRDLIVYRGNSYINRDEAEHYGVEIRMESERYRHHHLRISYAYTHAQDSEDEALELIPEHRFKVEDTFTLTSELKWYLGYQYVGTRYSSNTATYSDEQKKLEAYHLADTQLAYEPTPSITCRIGIKNLLDKTYAWQYGYPAEGRSFYLSLDWQL
ncbi:MAG: TonB-dependent receptor [Campylobacterota bacterium]|nr:TonB-dependent receptor [Campylobacterota bacterium]